MQRSTKDIIALLDNNLTTGAREPLSLKKQLQETAEQAEERANRIEQAKQLAAGLDNKILNELKENDPIVRAHIKDRLATVMASGATFFKSKGESKPLLSKDVMRFAQLGASETSSPAKEQKKENVETPTNRRGPGGR